VSNSRDIELLRDKIGQRRLALPEAERKDAQSELTHLVRAHV